MSRSRSESLSRSRRRSRDDSSDDLSSADVGRQHQARRRRDSTATLLLGSLKDSLPGRLSQSPLFDGKNPELILQRQPPQQDRGFKMTMWREGESSTVLMENARNFLEKYRAVGDGDQRRWYKKSNKPIDIIIVIRPFKKG